jgi:hypothetical protein
MTRKILIVLGLLLVLLLPSRVSAAGDIKLTGSGTRIDFPGAITFNIKAESSAPINRIRLRYEVNKSLYVPAYAEAWPEFTSSKNVSAKWTWDTRTDLIPPGAQITYWWVIEDNAGNKLTTPRETVSFDDDRYKWQKISSKMITLYWYKGGNAFAEDLLKTAVEAADKLGRDTGIPLENQISIYIYANPEDLKGSMVATEDWTGGVKYIDFNVISIGISASILDWGKKAIAHELGHEITRQHLTSPYSAFLPLWLDEGMAMHAEGQQEENARDALVKSVEDGSIATLKSLSGPFPADPNDTAYAYAQSQSVVEYMLEKYGNKKMNELLTYFNDGHTFDESMITVYGIDTTGLDEAWKKYMLSKKNKGNASEKAGLPVSLSPEYAIPALSYGGI